MNLSTDVHKPINKGVRTHFVVICDQRFERTYLVDQKGPHEFPSGLALESGLIIGEAGVQGVVLALPGRRPGIVPGTSAFFVFTGRFWFPFIAGRIEDLTDGGFVHLQQPQHTGAPRSLATTSEGGTQQGHHTQELYGRDRTGMF